MSTDSQGNIHDTTGQFATKNRDEGTVALTPPEALETCRVCGSTEDVGYSDDRCDECVSDGTDKCRECAATYSEDGDGYDGMCGNCADQAEGPWCSECGELMRVNGDGTSVHLDEDFEEMLGEEDPGHAALLDMTRDYIVRSV